LIQRKKWSILSTSITFNSDQLIAPPDPKIPSLDQILTKVIYSSSQQSQDFFNNVVQGGIPIDISNRSVYIETLTYSMSNQEDSYGKAVFKLTLPKQPARNMIINISPR
jgi:hypothetical protein